MNIRKFELAKAQQEIDFAAARDLAKRLRRCIDTIHALETAIGVRQGTILISGGWVRVNDPRSTEQLEADLAQMSHQRRDMEQATRNLQARINNRGQLIERCEQYIRRTNRAVAPRVIDPPSLSNDSRIYRPQPVPTKTETEKMREDLSIGGISGGSPLEPFDKKWG